MCKYEALSSPYGRFNYNFDNLFTPECSICRGRLAVLAAAGILSACLCMLAGVGMLQSRKPTALLASRHYHKTGLYYKDRGLSGTEKEAIQRSKDLARNVRLEEERNPSLVKRFMSAYAKLEQDAAEVTDHARVDLIEEYNFGFKPWARAHGLKGSRTSQLKVIMTECVKCVSECPAYVKNPIKAGNYEDFSRQAKKECGMCFEGVEGPCPANKDNHGVLHVAHEHATTLHLQDSAPNPVAGTYAVDPYTKATYPRTMGTNQVFLGKAYKASFAKKSTTLKVASNSGTSKLSTNSQPNPVAGTYAVDPYSKASYPRSMGTNQVFLGHAN